MLALILATLATAGVFLYSRGVKEEARQGGDLVTVVVSKVDIPANTDLNALVRENQFVTKDVPSEALIDDPITDASQLRNRRNSVYIFAGEQIPVGRVQGGEVPGGPLSIPQDHQAITVSLGAPRAIGAALAGGDNVTVYATFNDVVLKKRNQQASTTEAGAQETASLTTVLVPEVEVLRVFVPTVSSATGGEDGQDVTGNISVTLAFLPQEAQKFVFALELGSVYMSLLPPGSEGTDLQPLTVSGIVNPGGGKR
jgi:pilus assembly protein CpaB